MKSSYELAMERLERTSGPSQKLSDQQKMRLAELDTKFEARIAELKMAFDQKMAAATSFEDLSALRETLASELRRFEEKRTEEKEAIWAETD